MAPTPHGTARSSSIVRDISVLPSPSKRKRPAAGTDGSDILRGANKKSRVKKPIDPESLDLAKGLNHAIARLDSPLLADYIAQRTKRFAPHLSLLELQDRYVPGISEHYLASFSRFLYPWLILRRSGILQL